MPNTAVIDEDLIHNLKILSATTAFDALLAFTKAFCIPDRHQQLNRESQQITKAVTRLQLQTPQIVMTSKEELGDSLWDYLQTLNNKESRLESPNEKRRE